MKWEMLRILNLSTCPQTWKLCILVRIVVSNSHQIVDWPCIWLEFMEYEGRLHLTRDGTVHVHRVNVVFITGCDLCTTCLTRTRSVWNVASYMWSLCRTMIAKSSIAKMLINVAETNEKVGTS